MAALPLTVLNLALENLFNKALALDPASRAHLAPWQGCRLDFRLEPAGVGFALVLGEQSVRVLQSDGLPADASIQATPLALLRFLVPGEQTDGAAPQVRIEGNTELAEAFRSLLHHLEPDWEAELAKLLGDVLAHAAGRQLRQALSWGRQAGSALTRDLEEYLAEEARLLVNRGELHPWGELATLEPRLDDLEQRIERLGQALAQAAPRPSNPSSHAAESEQ